MDRLMSEQRLEGAGATPLSGTGTAVWYTPEENIELPDPADIEVKQPEVEKDRFTEVRDQARSALQSERETVAEKVGEDKAEVFDAHIQFLDDPQIESSIENQIEREKAAEHAVNATFQEQIEKFERMDGRMAERADDLRDVRDRLLRRLLDQERVDLRSLPAGSVVLAERLTPSDTAQLDPGQVAGFATVAGGRTSHAAIFARSLALPAVVGVGERLRDVSEGSELLVNGDDGAVVVSPNDDTLQTAQTNLDANIIDESVTTNDGKSIEVAANIGTPAEIDPAANRGADGIGLFRTEFLFLERDSPPSESEQLEVYTDALEAFPDGRVIFRTLDIGGDKPIPYLDLPDEENPFLGDRGIRRSLGDDADLFETQLRALLRAAGSDTVGDVAIMLPLVTTIGEIKAAQEQLDSVAADLKSEGVPYSKPEFGVMIETPAAALKADALAQYVDFFSIGTNDLTQYVMAAERGNEVVEELGDYRQPAVLRAIRRTVEGAMGNNCWVGMCGEMAGDPDLTELLIGLGLDELSMSAVTVPAVKEAVQDVNLHHAKTIAVQALSATTKSEVLDIIYSDT